MATSDETQLLRPTVFDSGAVPGAKHKILVGIAPRTQPYDESMDSLDAAMAHAFRSGVEIVVEKLYGGVPGFQNWGPAINQIAKDKTLTHLFCAADDMLYPVDILTRLVGHDKDIICGIYRKSIPDKIEPAGFEDSADGFIVKFTSGRVFETEWMSGHTAMIKRKVIETMIRAYPVLAYDNTANSEPYYALAMPMIRDRKLYQDDWAFSIRAKASGFTIWNDYGCRCRHFCGHFIGFEELEAGVANG